MIEKFLTVVKRMLTIEGISAIIFGLVVLLWPDLSLGVLFTLFAIFLIISGIKQIITGFVSIGVLKNSYMYFISGILLILVGALAFRHTQVALNVGYYLIASAILLMGIVDTALAISLKDSQESTVPYILSGVVNILFAILLFFAPTIGTAALIYLVGSLSILYGSVTIGLAIYLQSLKKKTK